MIICFKGNGQPQGKANPKDLVGSETNPYEKYRHVAFTLDEFLNMVKAHRGYFIHYCEIVITRNGLIFLASPSHDSVVEWLKKKGFVDCISVWYNTWEFGRYNVWKFRRYDIRDYKRLAASQLRVLNSLINHGIILDMPYIGFYGKRI